MANIRIASWFFKKTNGHVLRGLRSSKEGRTAFGVVGVRLVGVIFVSVAPEKRPTETQARQSLEYRFFKGMRERL